MRRFIPPVPCHTLVRLAIATVVAAGLAISIQAQVPGRNVNMVSGVTWPLGDPYLQRQNEPSMAASTRNPLHLLGGSNDYRTVDVPFPPDDDEETGDAWLGLFKSFDGGQRWTSSLVPGYPQDQSPAGLASPLKAYQAGADPVVRAGTHGLLYYSGLAFDRGENGKSAIFLARFIDNNNKESGDPIAYLGTTIAASATGAKFYDKPWMAVDIPRDDAQMCIIPGSSSIQTTKANTSKGKKRHGGPKPRPDVQRIPAGTVYVAYSSITGEGTSLKSEILLTRSTDCGATWSRAIKISRPEDPINQGATITIDPRSGAVYVAWRRFSKFATPQNPTPPDQDAVMVARLPYGGKKVDPPCKVYGFPWGHGRKVTGKLDRIFEHRGKKEGKSEEAGEVEEFDQGSSVFSFRTNAYPAMAADGSGRVYVAWTQRGFIADSAPGDGARIVMVTTRDGRNFTNPVPVDDDAQRGHQLMPSLAFAGGRLMLVYYDLRETHANYHGKFVTDQQTLSGLRHTMDIRSAVASPGDHPNFAPSVRVSDYLMGINPKTETLQQLQVNPPNLPMFRQGTTPFMGDYIDVAAAPAFVPGPNGKWGFNTAATKQTPVFHATWTDNRDVRPPKNGDWTKYTPAQMSPGAPPRQSLVDPGITVPTCEDGNAGSRNQNVYSARITGGLLAGSPGNTKPLSTTLQRGFVVFAQNATAEMRSFRMTIRNQPVGGKASFDQFAPKPVTSIDMKIPPRSTAARTVYATSSDAHAIITVDVAEIDTNGQPIPLGLGSSVVLNPDIENPDIENPDIENPDVENPDIENSEVYNPDIENPDIENPDIENPDVENVRLANPDIENPDIENPDIENPDIENVLVANPDIENLNISNPDIENPDIENPDIENPDIENPDIENGSIADVTWKVENTGNTSAAFNVNVFLAQQNLPAGVKTQLILFKTYRTPVTVANGCQLGFQTRNVLLSSILNPSFILPSSGGVPDQNNPSDKNATMWLGPGEGGRITLRVIDDDTSNNLIITKDDGSTVSIDPAYAPTTGATPGVASQGVGTEDKNAGKTDPPLVTPSGANLFFLQMPVNGVTGVPLAPPVRVQVRDDLTGTPVPGAAVTITLGSNPGLATLTGNIAISDAAGIATFPALAVSAPGIGYTLVAKATTVAVTASAESTPFDVSLPLVVTTTTLPGGTAGLGYFQTLQSSGGSGIGRTWSLITGGLPTGLTLEPGTGNILGTIHPGARGLFSFTVQVVDTALPPHTATQPLSIAVGALADVAISLSDNPDPAAAGASVTYMIMVGNAGPSTATSVVVTDTLPSSAQFISASAGCGAPVNGVVLCAIAPLSPGAMAIVTVVVKPAGAGTVDNTASVSAAEADPMPGNNTATESTTVQSSVDVALPSQSERTAQLGVAYALSLNATGGTPPYTWSQIGGVLPPGMTLNSVTGVISGTAQVTGAFNVTVRAEDSIGVLDTLTLCISVVFPPAANFVTKAVGDVGGPTVADLVTTLLGQGVTVSNVQLTGANAGAGVFDGAASVLGFHSGIVLSSGRVNDAAGPNNSDETTTTHMTGGDAQLTTLAGQPTFDATVLEFDFVPTGNQVSFRYVFASEEYNEYVATAFNDVFAFYIQGPFDEVGQNQALVPGTGQPVAINTINGGRTFGTDASNPELFRNNDLQDGGGTIDIEADGLTVVLTLTATVTPGATHHMKLAIADAGDRSLDSWVFIEGGSFHAVENCTNGIDDDGDGLVDGNDPDCTACAEEGNGPVLVSVPATSGGLANENSPPSGSAPVQAMTLEPNQQVSITATGSVSWQIESLLASPDGAGFEADAASLAPGLAAVALIARIGEGPWQFVGAGPTILQAGPFGGVLEFAVNDSSYNDNSGSFTVTIQP